VPTVPSTQLYPEVVDASTLIAKPSAPIFLPIGVEGEAANDGSASVGIIYTISTVSQARTTFGVEAKITKVLEVVIAHGAFPVLAIASKKGTPPTLPERQTQWDALASDANVRIRLTDSVVQADLAALADSCEQAELVQNKQVGFGGLATASDKTTHITAAGAITSNRFCLVGPGVYDQDGTLRDGSYAAAVVASEVAKNSDLANDLDLWPLPLLAGIEKSANGLPVFRKKVASGVAVNDFEELLQGGVSPLQPSRVGGSAETTHLRTTYTTNTAYDALSTRLISDQVFVDIRNHILDQGYLRRGNTEAVRSLLVGVVTSLLFERQAWVAPITQADGNPGYNVQAVASADNRQVTVSYEGRIVRGIQTIQIASNLSIPV
jgi:hypothetical protein